MHTQPVLVLASLILFFNLFFFRVIGDFGIQLFFLGLFCYFIAIASLQKTMKYHLPFLIGAGSVLGVLTYFSVRLSNDTIQFLIHFLSAGSVALAWYASIAHRSILVAAMEVFFVPIELFKAYFNMFDSVSSKKTSETWEKTQHSISRVSRYSGVIRPVLVGLLVSVPVLFILLQLFSSADPVFAKFISDIFNKDLPERVLWRVGLSIVALLVGIPTLMMKITKDFSNPIKEFRYLRFITEYTVVMVLVAAVTALFLAVQWQYIFVPPVSGVDLSQYGIATYSEYVNKGFTELLTVSVFIFSLVWFGLILMRNEISQKATVLKSVQFLVLIEFVVLLASVWRRIWLYQHFHGMTLVRFYGGYFLFFLLLLTATLAARHVYKLKYVRLELLMGVLSILGLAIFSPEKYIALHHPPTVNDRVDYVYLSRMSPDGYEGWKKSYEWSKGVLDAQYAEGKIITADQRREIYYAGIVTGQLLSKFDYLLSQYGNEEEKKEYLRAVVTYSLANIARSRQVLEVKQVEALSSPNKDQLLTQLGTLRNELNNTEAELNKIMDEINKNEIKSYQRVKILSASTTWSNTRCSFWEVCSSYDSWVKYVPNSFYGIDSIPNERVVKYPSNGLDMLLSYHSWEQELSQTIQLDMPISDLLRLQDQYFSLLKRISRQPEEERVINSDISFNTPFLQPLHY